MTARTRETAVASLANLRAAVEEKDPIQYGYLREVKGMRDEEFRLRTNSMTQEIIRDIGEVKKKLYEEGFRAGMKSFEEGAKTAVGRGGAAQPATVMHIDYDRAFAQKMAALEEKLLGKISSNTNYIASEVRKREDDFRATEARLRSELDSIKGVAAKVNSLEEGLSKSVRKPFKQIEARISEVDNRIDSQLIGSVIGGKQLDEKIAAAEKKILAQVRAAPEAGQAAVVLEKRLDKQFAGVRKAMRAIERSVSAVDNRIDSQLVGSVIGGKQIDEKIREAQKKSAAPALGPQVAKAMEAVQIGVATHGKKVEKQLARIRREMRGLGRDVSGVDNRIDSQLIGSVIGSRQMDEKIRDAEKRILARQAAPAAKPATRVAAVKARAPAAKAARKPAARKAAKPRARASKPRARAKARAARRGKGRK